MKDIISNMGEGDTVYCLGVDKERLEELGPIYLKQYFKMVEDKNRQEKVVIAEEGYYFEDEDILEYRQIDPEYLDNATTFIHQYCIHIYSG